MPETDIPRRFQRGPNTFSKRYPPRARTPIITREPLNPAASGTPHRGEPNFDSAKRLIPIATKQAAVVGSIRAASGARGVAEKARDRNWSMPGFQLKKCSTKVSAPRPITAIAARSPKICSDLDERTLDRIASATAQSTSPAAIFGLSGVDPGIIHFNPSLLSHQPARATPPNSAVNNAAILPTNRHRDALDPKPEGLMLWVTAAILSPYRVKSHLASSRSNY